jgi:hypothetical protein
MRSRGVTLSARHERWIYAVLAFVYLTGIVWIVLHYGVTRTRGPDDPWRVVETWTLAAHGAAAMLALVAAGSMLAVHVPTAWALGRNLASGAGMLALLGLLVITGWLLYYASGEATREWSSYLHMVAGTVGPLGLLWHLAYRKRLTRVRRETGRQARTAPAARAAGNVLPWGGRRQPSRSTQENPH